MVTSRVKVVWPSARMLRFVTADPALTSTTVSPGAAS